MNILITGVAGFIGSHLAEALLGQNRIIGVDNFCNFYDPQIKETNIKGFIKNDNFKLYRVDIRDYSLLEKVFRENKVDLVIHLAAMAGVRPSIENPLLYTEVNVNGTVNLLDLCANYNIDKFIFASSSSVYGNNKKVPFAESDSVDNPISPYAATKKAGELLCYTYNNLYDMSFICLRFFTVYGPRQRPDLAIHKFTKMINNNEPIPVFGDGSTKRDYTFINDIIDGIKKSIEFVSENKKCYEIFNLGESQTVSLNHMIQTIEKTLGKKALRKNLTPQPGDVEITYADISKSKSLLGYNPKTKFDDGIKIFCNWFLNNYNLQTRES